MKKILFNLALFVLILAGCSEHGTNEQSISSHDNKWESKDKDPIDHISFKKREPRKKKISMINKEGYDTAFSSLAMVDSFESVAELVIQSDYYIEGEIISNEYTEYDDIPFTISTIKILMNLNESDNEISMGDTIKVLQTGGLYTQKDIGGDEKAFTTEAEKKDFKENIAGTIIEMVANNSPVLKENATTILFLQKYEGPIGNDLYVATGDYQGRFVVESDDYIEPQSEIIISEDENYDFTMKEIQKEITDAE